MKIESITSAASIMYQGWSANRQRRNTAALQTRAMLLGLALTVTGLAPYSLQAAGPAPIDLKSAANFTILAGSTVTTTGGGIINGNVGLSPAGSEGIPPAQVNGVIYNGGPIAAQAQVDLNAAIIAASPAGLPGGANVGAELGGLVLAPGIYQSPSGAYGITLVDLTLNGGPDDVWVFQMASTLTVGVGRKVILTGGAQARNVFWQVGSSATLDVSSVFKGTIMAYASVTMNATSTLEGRALAQTGAVTYNGTSGSLPNNGPLTIITAHGAGSPPAGIYTNMYGVSLTNRVTGLETVGGTQYVASGWTLVGNTDTNGQVSGITTNNYMIQTNTATLTWLWTTNYQLNASSDPNGSLTGSTNGWYLAGSSVTVTSTPSLGYHFVGWTGDVSGPSNNAVQTLTMNQSRTAMAHFAAGIGQTFTVVSEHGIGLPVAGIYNTSSGDTLTNSMSAEEILGGTQYVAVGWSLIGGVDTNGQMSDVTTNQVMVQTNNAVLTWLWTTNYLLNATADPNGSVTGSTNGWYVAGSSVSVTAVPNPNYIFAGWTGDVTDPTNNIAQNMTLDQARTAMAHFVPGVGVDLILTIASEHGTGQPPVGTYTNSGSTTLTNSITGVEVVGGTQYVAIGWTMTGNDPVAGSGTTVVMTQTNNAVLTWLWSTNYWLAISTSGSGGVTPTSGWQTAGGIALLTATPGVAGSSVGWTGDTNGCVVVGATLAVPMTQARAITAVFASSTIPVIAGKITRAGSSTGVAGILVTLTGGGLATTDASGNYSCHVPVGWSGFATPSSTNGGIFTPITRSYTNLPS